MKYDPGKEGLYIWENPDIAQNDDDGVGWRDDALNCQTGAQSMDAVHRGTGVGAVLYTRFRTM